MFISWKGDLRGRVKKTKSYPTQAMTLYNRQPFNGIVFDAERLAEVFTLHDPMPTTGAPMRFNCPVINFMGLCFELAGVRWFGMKASKAGLGIEPSSKPSGHCPDGFAVRGEPSSLSRPPAI